MRTRHISGSEVTTVLKEKYLVLSLDLSVVNSAPKQIFGAAVANTGKLASTINILAVGAGFNLIINEGGDAIPAYQGFGTDELDVQTLWYTNTLTGANGLIFVIVDG